MSLAPEERAILLKGEALAKATEADPLVELRRSGLSMLMLQSKLAAHSNSCKYIWECNTALSTAKIFNVVYLFLTAS